MAATVQIPSSQLLSFYSQTSNLSTPFPNPFPVPDSDLILIFGPLTAVAPTLRNWIPHALLRVWEDAFLLVTENKKVMPFPDITYRDSIHPIQISVESEKGPNGKNLVVSSTMADAITGIMYYMLHEGFSTTKINLVRPNQVGRRMRVGLINITQRSELEMMAEARNAINAAAATS